jgi:predicted RecA/RadA family phage recombinase
MTETTSERRPRRDAGGRLVTIGDLLGVALAGLVCGVAVLLLFEGVMSLFRVSEFGATSGWLALILPIWLFTEEFRAAAGGSLRRPDLRSARPTRARRNGAYRFVVAPLAAGFGVAVGMTLAGFTSPAFPPIVSGAVGAAGLTVAYSLVWFYGLRWLSHRAG